MHSQTLLQELHAATKRFLAQHSEHILRPTRQAADKLIVLRAELNEVMAKVEQHL